MRYDELKTLIQPHVAVPVEDLYADFRTATGKEDADHFLAYLQERELITTDVFRELASRGEVDLGPVGQTSGETQGVMGATMMQPGGEAPRALHVAAAQGGAAAGPAKDERPNYAMMGLLGEGSMGKIYLAKDLSLRRKVAFKELKRELAAASPDIRERFINEAQITAQMDHPNVVPVYTIEVKDEQCAYAMKLVQGKTLKELVNETRTFYDLGKELDDDHALSTRLEYFLRICDAMSYAHSKGVIHRDLKPANIMIGRYNEVYVMDWGIARMVQSIMQPEATTMIELARKDGHMPVIEPTQAGQAVGTPRYMSPEQAAGANMDLDERSDLYTLGTILFEMVVLKPAITGNSLKEAMVNVMKGNLEPFEHYSPRGEIPRELKAIIQKSVALDREKRYRTVKEFSDDIRRYMRGDPVSVLPDQLTSRLQRWISKHRQATLMLVMALLLLSATVLVWSLMRENTARARQVRQTQILGDITSKARALDTELGRLQALVEGTRAAALMALDRPPAPGEGDGPRYFTTDEFAKQAASEAGGPLALEAAPAYGNKPVSVAWPIATLSPKALAAKGDAAAWPPLERQLIQLSAMSSHLARVLLRSQQNPALGHQGPASGQQLGVQIRKDGLPVTRVFVALASGVQVSYPGVASLPATFDPVKAAWYERAFKPGVHWSAPKIDGQGQGVILTCTTAIVDASGSIVGVVGLDLRVAHLVHNFLTAGESGVEACYLLDREGRVLLQSGQDGTDSAGAGGKPDTPVALAAAPSPEAVRLAQAGRTDHQTAGDKLIVCCPLDTLPASLVVVIDGSQR